MTIAIFLTAFIALSGVLAWLEYRRNRAEAKRGLWKVDAADERPFHFEDWSE